MPISVHYKRTPSCFCFAHTCTDCKRAKMCANKRTAQTKIKLYICVWVCMHFNLKRSDIFRMLDLIVIFCFCDRKIEIASVSVLRKMFHRYASCYGNSPTKEKKNNSLLIRSHCVSFRSVHVFACL